MCNTFHLKHTSQNKDYISRENEFDLWLVELEPFLILPRVDLGYDLLQLPLGLALWEVVHVIVLWGNPAT